MELFELLLERGFFLDELELELLLLLPLSRELGPELADALENRSIGIQIFRAHELSSAVDALDDLLDLLAEREELNFGVRLEVLELLSLPPVLGVEGIDGIIELVDFSLVGLEPLLVLA